MQWFSSIPIPALISSDKWKSRFVSIQYFSLFHSLAINPVVATLLVASTHFTYMCWWLSWQQAGMKNRWLGWILIVYSGPCFVAEEKCVCHYQACNVESSVGKGWGHRYVVKGCDCPVLVEAAQYTRVDELLYLVYIIEWKGRLGCISPQIIQKTLEHKTQDIKCNKNMMTWERIPQMRANWFLRLSTER